jgi:hypothetical protein
MFNRNIFSRHKRSALSAAIMTGLLAQSGVVLADSYTFNTPLGNNYDPAASTDNSSYFNAINNSGTTVGAFTEGTTATISGTKLKANNTYGFDGNTLFNPSGSLTNQVIGNANNISGINTTGSIAGSYYIGSTTNVSFIAASATAAQTTIYDTNTTGGGAVTVVNSYAQGLNDSGLVVGYNVWSAGNNTGFVYNNSMSTVDGIAAGAYLDVTAANDNGGTQFNAVNNNGIAVGDVVVGGVTEGLVYNLAAGATTGTLLEFSVPTATMTEVTGINLGVTGTALAGKDEIVGFWVDGSGTNHGFSAIFNPSTNSISSWISQSIDAPNSNATVVTGVNDNGTLVGYLTNATTGSYQGFTATATTSAVPVPGAAWLMTSALAGLGLFGRRRQAS